MHTRTQASNTRTQHMSTRTHASTHTHGEKFPKSPAAPPPRRRHMLQHADDLCLRFVNPAASLLIPRHGSPSSPLPAAPGRASCHRPSRAGSPPCHRPGRAGCCHATAVAVVGMVPWAQGPSPLVPAALGWLCWPRLPQAEMALDAGLIRTVSTRSTSSSLSSFSSIVCGLQIGYLVRGEMFCTSHVYV